MPSTPPVPVLSVINGNPSADQRVPGAQVDSNNALLRQAVNDLLVALGTSIRDDNQLTDRSVKLRCADEDLLDFIRANGGGGSVSASGGVGYNVRSIEFGASGDGGTHPLTTTEAAAYNTAYASVGFQGANAAVAGDERDWAAIQAALYKAAVTGAQVYLPFGTYIVNKPLTLMWTATPITGQPSFPLIARIIGDGPSTKIYAKNIGTGRGALELLGESNSLAVNCKVSDLTIEEDASCHRYSWCLRVGDGWAGINLDRVICKGANGIRLKVASSGSYANLCTQITQCVVWTNWASRWHVSETTADVYALAPESGGSYWDNVKFLSCIFQGQVDVRAFVLNFDDCQFFTPSNRPDPSNRNVTVLLGTASFYNCYFEDHYVAITSEGAIAPVSSISIRDCHFSGVNNNPVGVSHRAISCAAATYQHGPVTIENCRFGPSYSYSHIDLYGPITVAVLRCSAPWTVGINTGPTITKTATVRLIEWSPNGVLAEDTVKYTNVRAQIPTMTGPTKITQDLAGSAENTDENTNAGNAASIARVITCNGFTGKLAAYGASHATLANQFWIFTTSNNPVIIGINGTETAKFSEFGQRVEGPAPGYSGEFGLILKNPNTGALGVTMLRMYQSQNKGLAMLAFGGGHPLAGQSWITTQTPDPFILGYNGTEALRISDEPRWLNYAKLGGLAYGQTAIKTWNTSFSDTSLISTGVGSMTMPANAAKLGRGGRLRASGTLSTNVTPTITYKILINALLLSTVSVAAASGLANAGWSIDFSWTYRTVGAGGTLIGQGVLILNGACYPFTMLATAAIDTTVANTWDASGAFSISHVSNDMKVQCLTLEMV